MTITNSQRDNSLPTEHASETDKMLMRMGAETKLSSVLTISGGKNIGCCLILCSSSLVLSALTGRDSPGFQVDIFHFTHQLIILKQSLRSRF